MTGIFDSGVGGFNALYELRRLLPREDIIYLADVKNAPYGTKTEDELIRLVKEDIRRLHGLGCERILIACCTASTVWYELSELERKITIPIIAPSATLAASRGGKITVIATERTVRTKAFSREIIKISNSVSVTELSAQGLVALVECGNRDGNTDGECAAMLDEIAEEARSNGSSALILGCTHFSHLKRELAARLPNVEIINPAEIGARYLLEKYGNEAFRRERGRTVYI